MNRTISSTKGKSKSAEARKLYRAELQAQAEEVKNYQSREEIEVELERARTLIQEGWQQYALTEHGKEKWLGSSAKKLLAAQARLEALEAELRIR